MTRLLTAEESFRLNMLASTDRDSALKYITKLLHIEGTKTRRRRNIVVEHEGEPMSLAELAERTGVPRSTIFHRYSSGLRGKSLLAPVRRK